VSLASAFIWKIRTPGYGLPEPEIPRPRFARGYDPATPLEAYRGELCLRVRSIGEGAKLTVRESAAGTTPQDGADRQRAVVLASTQRDELGIDD